MRRISEDVKKEFAIQEQIKLEEGLLSFFKKIVSFFAKKILKRNKYIVDFDFDIPDAYSTSDGDLVGYYAYLDDGREIRLNYLLDGSSKNIYSVDLIAEDDTYDKPSRTIVLDIDISTDEINDAINELITGNLQEGSVFTDKEMHILEKKSPAKEQVYEWIEDPEFYDARLDILQDEKLSRVYAEYVRTTDYRPVSQASFITYVKKYLHDNGMSNKWTRGAYTVKRNKQSTPIEVGEEKGYVKSMKDNSEMMFSWKEAFEDMEDDFEDLIDDPKSMPFGQLVYGNGGTGKSFFYVQEAKKYDAMIIKGAPNTSRLVRILYDYRDKDIIIFDDADSIITNANSANILKMATDDTAAHNNDGARIIYLPKGSGKDMKGVEPDVYDSDGNIIQAFYFYSSIVVITNLPDVKDKALKTRLYLNPIFMSKADIIEKIMLTVEPEKFGATEIDSRLVADLLVSLVENNDFDITNDQLSYRFFKIGLKLRKKYPDNWTGKLIRKLGIGITSSYKQLKDRS